MYKIYLNISGNSRWFRLHSSQLNATVSLQQAGPLFTRRSPMEYNLTGHCGHACIAPSSDPAVTGGIFSHWLTSDPISWLKIWKKKKTMFLMLFESHSLPPVLDYYWDLKAGNNASQLGWWILHILWWMDKKPGDFIVTPASTSPCNTGFCLLNAFTSLALS